MQPREPVRGPLHPQPDAQPRPRPLLHHRGLHLHHLRQQDDFRPRPQERHEGCCRRLRPCGPDRRRPAGTLGLRCHHLRRPRQDRRRHAVRHPQLPPARQRAGRLPVPPPRAEGHPRPPQYRHRQDHHHRRPLPGRLQERLHRCRSVEGQRHAHQGRDAGQRGLRHRLPRQLQGLPAGRRHRRHRRGQLRHGLRPHCHPQRRTPRHLLRPPR